MCSRFWTKTCLRRCFAKIAVLKSFAKFTGEHLCWNHFLIQACNFIKKWLHYSYFPVSFAKFLIIPILQKTSGRLFPHAINSIVAAKMFTITIRKTFTITILTCCFYKFKLFKKQLVYKQLALGSINFQGQPFQSNSKKYRLKKSGVFPL